MTIAEWCLLGAALLPLITLASAKALAAGEFDNSNPRNSGFYEKPVRRRALGAHLNGFEVFPFFAASILLAEFKHSPQPWLDGFAVAFLLTRVVYVIVYVGNRPTVRTMLWNTAFALNLGIFFLSGFGIRGAMIATLVGIVFAVSVGVMLSLRSVGT